MRPTWLVACLVAAAAAVFTAPSPPPQRPAPQRLATGYGDWLVPFVGREFYVSPDLTVATEVARTSAVPPGAVAFTLAGVAQDFAWFENRTERVCIPLAALRAVLKKS